VDPQQRSIAEEFDQYNESYDSVVNQAIAFSGQKVASFTKAKAKDLLRTISDNFQSCSVLDVLDVGCGIGNYHPFLTPFVRSVSGVDVSSACIAKAQRRNPAVNYLTYDGDILPYPDQSFDVTVCVCVLHHVPPDRWQQFTCELHRVTRPGGLLIIYEHNPEHPLTRKVVRDCEFDRDAVLLNSATARELLKTAKCSEVSTVSIFTLPPWGGPIEWMDRLFAKLPFGAQYRATGRVGATL